MGADVGRAYTGAAAIMVESSALSTLSGIAYLVTFALGSDLEIFFLSIYVMCTVRPLHLTSHFGALTTSFVYFLFLL